MSTSSSPARRLVRLAVPLLLLVVGLAAAHAARPRVYALVGGTIVPSPGRVLERGTLVLRDGLVEAVGTSVRVPADAVEIDATGLWIYPAFVDAGTQLPAAAAEAGGGGRGGRQRSAADTIEPARGVAHPISRIRPEHRASEEIAPWSGDRVREAAAYRGLGFGAILAAPRTGVLRGRSSVLLLLDDAPARRLVLRDDVAQHVAFERGSFGEGYPTSLMGAVAALRQAVLDARRQAEWTSRWTADPAGMARPERVPAFDALEPVLARRQAIVVEAGEPEDALLGDRLARELALEAWVIGSGHEWEIAPAIAASGRSLVLPLAVPDPPSLEEDEEGLELSLRTLRRHGEFAAGPGRLHRAGVTLAFTTRGVGNLADVPATLRSIVERGLPEDIALAALTTVPARLLGVERSLGRLEPGFLANVTVASGPIFARGTKVRRVFVDGDEYRIEEKRRPAGDPTAVVDPRGTWSVALELAGGTVQRTWTIEGAPGSFTGTAETRSGTVAFERVELEGNLLTVALPARGEAPPVEAVVVVAGDRFEGSAEVGGRSVPVRGTRTEAPPPPSTAPSAPPPDSEIPIGPSGPERLRPEVLLIRGGTVWTQGARGRLEGGDVLVRRGKVERVGAGLTAPRGAHVIEAAGLHVTPGLIDVHSHSAIRGGVNEGSNTVTAEVRVSDAIDPHDVDIYRQLAGGVTTAHLLHGSANAIGGQDAVIKLRWGADRAALLVTDARPGIKFALGENPKRANFQQPGRDARYPRTRMGVMEAIRLAFASARDFMEELDAYAALPPAQQRRREPPRRDLQLEALAEVLRGQRDIHAHAYRQDEILALVRLAESFGVRIGTFQHVLEGYKVADELARHGAGASTFSDWWAYKLEAFDAIPHNGALMHERGVLVTFNSDSPELARRLNLEAAKAVRYGGVSEEGALDFVTRNAARQLGIDHRTGSIEPGKDADLVLWSGHPLSPYARVESTWVDGVREWERSADAAFREAVQREHAARVARLRRPPARTQEEPRPERPAPPRHPREYAPGPAAEGAVSIVGATVHPVSGPALENATVSFREGRIVEVAAGAAPLPDATVVDGRGRHLFPGLIDASTALGLTEIGSVPGSVDLAETGLLNPQVEVAIAINPDSELLPVARTGGITHALSVPEGGLIRGVSALVRLDGWTWEDVAAVRRVAMHVGWPSFRVREPAPGDLDAPSVEDQRKRRDEDLRRIRRAFEDARAYGRARDARGAHHPDLQVDPALEALLPVLDGTLPLIVHADEVAQARSALAWAREEGVRIVLAGAGDLPLVAPELRAQGVPVIVTGVLRLPEREDSGYDDAYRVAARLHEAGVEFCIAGPGGSFAAPSTRNLPYHAAMAAAHGLPAEVALAAITIGPARILGVDRHLGSIEPGKSASLILTDGDPLEIRTRVLASWIDGRPVELEANRHERLYRKYRQRPRPAR